MARLIALIFALALFAAPLVAHASVALTVTQTPTLAASATPSTATPDAPNRVTGDVATFTPTPNAPTPTPTEALAGGPQIAPSPTPWTVVARLFLPLIQGE